MNSQGHASSGVKEFKLSVEDVAEVFAREDFFFGAGGEDFTFVEKEDVSEGFGNFLYVMGDEDVIGSIFPGGGSFEEVEEMDSCDWIQPCTGFVEDEEFDSGHQCSADEHFLFLTLGKLAPECVDEMTTFDMLQNVPGFVQFLLQGFSPEVDHGVTTTYQCPDHRLAGFDQVLNGGTDKAHLEFYLVPAIFPELFSQYMHLSGGGTHEGTQYV